MCPIAFRLTLIKGGVINAENRDKGGGGGGKSRRRRRRGPQKDKTFICSSYAMVLVTCSKHIVLPNCALTNYVAIIFSTHFKSFLAAAKVVSHTYLN